MKPKTKTHKTSLTNVNYILNSESGDEDSDGHEVEHVLLHSASSSISSSSPTLSNVQSTMNRSLRPGIGHSTTPSSRPRPLRTQKSNPQLASNPSNAHFNDTHRSSSNETLSPSNYGRDHLQSSSFASTSTTTPYPVPSLPWNRRIDLDSSHSYPLNPSSLSSLSSAKSASEYLFTPAGEITPPIATSRSTTSLGFKRKGGGTPTMPLYSHQSLNTHTNGASMTTPMSSAQANSMNVPNETPNHPPPPYEASITSPRMSTSHSAPSTATTRPMSASPYHDPVSASTPSSRPGSFLPSLMPPAVSASAMRSGSSPTITNIRNSDNFSSYSHILNPTPSQHTVRFDAQFDSGSSESQSDQSSESEEDNDLGDEYRGKAKSWGKRRQESAIYTARSSMNQSALTGGREGSGSSSSVSVLSNFNLSARRSAVIPDASGSGDGRDELPPSAHHLDQDLTKSRSTSPNRLTRIKPPGANSVNNSLRAKLLRFGLGLGWNSDREKKEKGREERMICTTPGRTCAGETETETDEDSQNLPTARIPFYRSFHQQHSPSHYSRLTSPKALSRLSSVTKLIPTAPNSPLLSPTNLQDRLIPLLFQFSRWLSVVPAVCGVIYCLWWLWMETSGDDYTEDRSDGDGALIGGHVKDIWRPSIPGRVDWFVAALWALLTGYQCLSLTTGLLTRWRVYYPPLSTLVRLLALQGICWPATHLSLSVIGGDVRPVMAWAVIGTTTSVSRSVQIWVTSNLWWEGVEPGGERNGVGNVGEGANGEADVGKTPSPAWTRWGGGGKWGGRRWDWKEVGVKCVLPTGVVYFIMAWAEVGRREWEGAPGKC